MKIAGNIKLKNIAPVLPLGISSVGLFALGALMAFPDTPDQASATTSETAIGANLTTSVHLATPNFALVFKPTASGTLQTVTQDVKAGTNNKTGYTLTMSSSSSQTALINTSDNTQTIPTLTSDNVASASFPVNSWGISTNSGSTYNAIKTSANAVTIKTTSAPSNEDTVPITIGTRANLSLASGTYTNIMTFTAVTNAVPTTYSITYNANGGTGAPAAQTADSFNTSYTFTLSSTAPTKDGYNFSGWCKSAEVSGDTCTGTLYQAGATSPTLTSASPSVTLKAIWESATLYMQNVATWGSSLTTNVSVQAVDSRDNKLYWVTKLADGNIWMTQNLALGSKTSPLTLTSADSDVSSSGFTLPQSVTEGSWSGSRTNPEFFDYVDNYDDSSTKYGNFYNWPAATAGANPSSGESSYSICPKGWRLPTGSSGGEFETMLTYYGYSDYYMDPDIFTSSPLSFVFSGYYYGVLYDQGTHADLWSSTAYNSNYAFYLYLYGGGDVSPDGSDGKDNGFTVRCVAR